MCLYHANQGQITVRQGTLLHSTIAREFVSTVVNLYSITFPVYIASISSPHVLCSSLSPFCELTSRVRDAPMTGDGSCLDPLLRSSRRCSGGGASASTSAACRGHKTTPYLTARSDVMRRQDRSKVSVTSWLFRKGVKPCKAQESGECKRV